MLRRQLSLIGLAALIAIPAHAAATLTVSLAANPSGQANVGQPVTLTATATVTGVKLTPREITLVNEVRFYKYEAKRTWPCAETISIPGNGPTTTWTPPATKAGDYTLVVSVSQATRPFAPPVRIPPTSASIPYHVNNVGGLTPITIGVSPTSSPVTSVAVSASMPPPAGATNYRWHLYCATQPGTGSGHCTNAPFAAIAGPQSSVNWPNVGVVGPVQLRFDVVVDVATSGCAMNSTFAYKFFDVQ